MIRARKQLPVLAEGDLQWLESLPNHALCFRRESPAGMVLALHNLSEEPFDVPLPESATFEDALAKDGERIRDTIRLAAYGYRWLTLHNR